jgi:hypothetical protein
MDTTSTFVNLVPGLDYVHTTQESTRGEDTNKVKKAFKHFASRHHVKVKHYHCSNRIFACKKFRATSEKADQTIIFWGVNAHHQNGIA